MGLTAKSLILLYPLSAVTPRDTLVTPATVTFNRLILLSYFSCDTLIYISVCAYVRVCVRARAHGKLVAAVIIWVFGCHPVTHQ
jgi:hypothetical protein